MVIINILKISQIAYYYLLIQMMLLLTAMREKNLMVILSQKKNDIELCQNRFLEDIIKLLNLDYESYKLKK